MPVALTLQASQVVIHPHVFVDGGVGFVFWDGNVLEALAVTRLYDEFGTLYVLSSFDCHGTMRAVPTN